MITPKQQPPLFCVDIKLVTSIKCHVMSVSLSFRLPTKVTPHLRFTKAPLSFTVGRDRTREGPRYWKDVLISLTTGRRTLCGTHWTKKERSISQVKFDTTGQIGPILILSFGICPPPPSSSKSSRILMIDWFWWLSVAHRLIELDWFDYFCLFYLKFIVHRHWGSTQTSLLRSTSRSSLDVAMLVHVKFICPQ